MFCVLHDTLSLPHSPSLLSSFLSLSFRYLNQFSLQFLSSPFLSVSSPLFSLPASLSMDTNLY